MQGCEQKLSEGVGGWGGGSIYEHRSRKPKCFRVLVLVGGGVNVIRHRIWETRMSGLSLWFETKLVVHLDSFWVMLKSIEYDDIWNV